jgi:outer membrane protein assembly factor BamA
MNRNWKAAIWAVVLSVVWMLAGSAQAVHSLPKRGDRVTVEGALTYVQTKGSAILELQTEEGQEYRIQIPFGMIAELRQKGFDPKVGEKMRVAGDVVCVLAEKPVIAPSEITINGKTHRMAPGPS